MFRSVCLTGCIFIGFPISPGMSFCLDDRSIFLLLCTATGADHCRVAILCTGSIHSLTNSVVDMLQHFDCFCLSLAANCTTAVLTSFFVAGCLGIDGPVAPGMLGSNLRSRAHRRSESIILPCSHHVYK